MKEIFLFLHLAGLIIGLGAVTVIDWSGFLGRKNKVWKKTTIKEHHVTKPLIWVGTILTVLSFLLLYFNYGFIEFAFWKFLILVVLILNGSFLSFYISPRLDKEYNSDKLLSQKIQTKIMISFIISFSGWWTFVFLTALSLV